MARGLSPRPRRRRCVRGCFRWPRTTKAIADRHGWPRRWFNPDANAAAYQPIYADILESVKGPTLAEWEAATHRVGKELVRGRAALALNYTQQAWPTGTLRTALRRRRSTSSTFRTGGHSETHSCEIRRQNGSETVGFRVRNGTAGAGIGTLWFGHRAGQFCGYAGGGRRSQCRGALHSGRCFPHGDQRAISVLTCGGF